MAFTIPNEADAFNADQAEPDKVDIDILVLGLQGVGVVSGCAVTAQGSPDMTCAVAAGTTRNADGTKATIASGNVTITAADATNPRIDLVVVNSSGTKSVTAGTAAASPVFPAIPATSVVLAAVYVPANDTTIASNQITDKRVVLPIPWATFKHTVLNGNGNKTTTSTTFTAIDATNLAYLTHDLVVGDVIRCTLQLQWYGSTSSQGAFDFEVDQPTSANVRVGEGADKGLFFETNAGPRITTVAQGLFTATEAGVHGFRPVWFVSTGTITAANAASGADDSVITFIVEKLGPVTA